MSPRRLVVSGIIAVVVLTASFAVFASEVMEAETDAIDDAILRALRTDDGRSAIGPGWLETAMVDVSALGSTTVAVLAVVASSTFLLLVRRPRHAVLVIACGAGTGLVITLVKGLVGRSRPTAVVALEPASGLSFPSGHAMLASALYTTLAIVVAMTSTRRRIQVFALATAAVLALLIGTSRVYLGVHYPSDVLGGWMLGIAWAITCGLVARKLHDKGVIENAVP